MGLPFVTDDKWLEITKICIDLGLDLKTMVREYNKKLGIH